MCFGICETIKAEGLSKAVDFEEDRSVTKNNARAISPHRRVERSRAENAFRGIQSVPLRHGQRTVGVELTWAH